MKNSKPKKICGLKCIKTLIEPSIRMTHPEKGLGQSCRGNINLLDKEEHLKMEFSLKYNMLPIFYSILYFPWALWVSTGPDSPWAEAKAVAFLALCCNYKFLKLPRRLTNIQWLLDGSESGVKLQQVLPDCWPLCFLPLTVTSLPYCTQYGKWDSLVEPCLALEYYSWHWLIRSI